MPVKDMTDEDRVRFFGSGLIILGMKRPSPPSTDSTRDQTHEQAAATSPEGDAGQDDTRREGLSL